MNLSLIFKISHCFNVKIVIVMMMKGGQNVNISEYKEANYAYFKILGITLKWLSFGTHPGLEAHQEFSP